MEFRTLRADEIDVRVAQLGEGKRGKWASLLLYKDARCDMRILDETVGAMDWQRDHKELKGNMYAGIGIWDAVKGQWIWKWDCGTESYTEAEKGEASDSFKRAAFNWGIGRELYTSPTIFLGDDVCKIEKKDNGKLACYDRFSVKSISYDDKRNINGLCIINSKNRKVVFNWGMTIDEPEPTRSTRSTPKKAENKPKEEVSSKSGNSGWQREKTAISKENLMILQDKVKTDEQIEYVQAKYDVNNLHELTQAQAIELIHTITKKEKEREGAQS